MSYMTPSARLGFRVLTACGAGPEGQEWTTDADCAEGLECHVHDGEEDHGECEVHDEDKDNGDIGM